MSQSRFLRYTFTLLFLTYECSAENGTNYQIVVFEYGSHVHGEEQSFKETGFIPPFFPLYTLNVTHSSTDLEQQYTYLRLEYMSPISSVDVVFEPDELTVTFHIMFPFMNIPYGVVGFSMKSHGVHTVSSTSRSDDISDE